MTVKYVFNTALIQSNSFAFTTMLDTDMCCHFSNNKINLIMPFQLVKNWIIRNIENSIYNQDRRCKPSHLLAPCIHSLQLVLYSVMQRNVCLYLVLSFSCRFKKLEIDHTTKYTQFHKYNKYHYEFTGHHPVNRIIPIHCVYTQTTAIRLIHIKI